MHGLLRPIPPSEDDLRTWLERHQHLLALERAEEEEAARLLTSKCSIKVLELRGLGIGGLGVGGISVGLGGKSLVELHRPIAYHNTTTLPPHTFRNGDPVRIEEQAAEKAGKRADKGDRPGVEGVVYRVTSEKIVVAVDAGKDIDLPERLRILKLANTVTFDRMARTLAHLSKLLLPSDQPGSSTPAAPNRAVIDALVGLRPPTWKEDAQFEVDVETAEGSGRGIKWFGDGLNDSQKEAIRFCLGAEQTACIHGPPGTGKTHTLIELIFQLLSRPASASTSVPPKILITTPSNLALDNLLLRLHAVSLQPPYAALLPPGAVLRLGHPTRVHRELVRETLDWQAANGDDGELVRDVKGEIEGHMKDLGRKKGEKGAMRGKERGKKWDEVRELRKEYRQREAKVVTNLLKAARVVLATCHTAGSRILSNTTFDVCIVDEATQAVEAVCWVPILRAGRVILAGDPKQLPPTIMSKADKLKRPAKTRAATAPIPEAQNGQDGSEGGSDNEELADTELVKGVADVDRAQRPRLKPPRTLETTLFERLERLYGPGIKRVLTVQYRMNSRIAAFPSDTLYDTALVSAPAVADRTLFSLPTVTNDSDDARDALEPTVVFFDTAGCEFYERAEGDDADGLRVGEGSKRNDNEAELVAQWARRLVKLGVPAAEIAVVTPYQAQVALVASLLREEFPDMTIGSVDGLQGQEREAIILSLVRSNTSGDVGFLAEYRRLNVAMTRAKRQLCVVGDSSTVGKGSGYLKKWMTWLEDNADVRYAGDGV
ncbi:hypothetical protein Q5752_003798 [Cryptotrichosporon argae]